MKTDKCKNFHNKYDKQYLSHRLDQEDFNRLTLSFYSFDPLEDQLNNYFNSNTDNENDTKSKDSMADSNMNNASNAINTFRDNLYISLSQIGVLGRIYLSKKEGVNAQLSVPEHNFEKFSNFVSNTFKNAKLNPALDHSKSFFKLTIKIKNQIVSDGDVLKGLKVIRQDKDKYLDARQWNKMIYDHKAKCFSSANADEHSKIKSVVVDIRNSYEHQVGLFKDSITMECETFRQQLKMLPERLKDYKDKNCNLMLYCTGGIRCEKASVWLLHNGFNNIYQLKGGIISYSQQVKSQGLDSYFIGKNFVFDNRMNERVSDQVISHCYTCKKPSDAHRNCSWQGCHTLFVQCDDCFKKYQGCCSEKCQENLSLPLTEQKNLLKIINSNQKLSCKDKNYLHLQSKNADTYQKPPRFKK